MRARLARPSLLIVALLLAAAPAPAQTAADKATARKLAAEGVEFYQAGKYAEALDKLERAEKLYDAPVHLLYIARTQAKLDKPVDAAETYRRLIRVKLEPDAPDVFRQAVDDAKKELPEIEATVPTLRVDVTPADAKNLELSIDGEKVSSAVVGVDRPLNPGEHVIVATADGYARSEQTATVAGGEHKTLTITLKPGAGAPETTGNTEQKATEADAGDEKKLGFFVGLRLLGAIPAGNAGTVAFGPAMMSRDVAMSDLMEAGGGAELHGGLRFMRYFAGKLYLDLFSMRPGSETADDAQVSGVEGGIGAHVGTAPHHLGGFGEIGIGFVQSFELKSENAGCVDDTTWRGGPSLRIGGGAVIPLSKYFQLTPFMVANFSSFNHVSAKVSCEATPALSTTVDRDIQGDEQSGHQLFLLGVGADWLIGG